MTMPINFNPQYITDKDGNKISVILPIEEFNSMFEDTEDIDKIWEDEAVARLEAYNSGTIETVTEAEFFNYEY
jgi:hypothetical protein